MTPRKKTELASRLDALGIDAPTLAAIVRRSVEEVTTWIENGPDAEAKVLLRVLDNPAAAELAAEQVRNTYTRTLESDAERRDAERGITDGWGGYRGADRTVPQ